MSYKSAAKQPQGLSLRRHRERKAFHHHPRRCVGPDRRQVYDNSPTLSPSPCPVFVLHLHQLEGIDDLGPPTHPNDLALDAEIGGGRELDDGVGDMMMEEPDYNQEPEFEQPELDDLGPVSQMFLQV